MVVVKQSELIIGKSVMSILIIIMFMGFTQDAVLSPSEALLSQGK